MYKKKFFSFKDSWQEVFVVLSQIGLLIFKEPGVAESKLIPVAMANLILVIPAPYIFIWRTKANDRSEAASQIRDSMSQLSPI